MMNFEETGLTGEFDTDYLDEYSMRVYGHKNWSFVPIFKTIDAGTLVMFFAEAEDETDGEDE